MVNVTKTDEEGKNQLEPLAYRVLRHEDTEDAFTVDCMRITWPLSTAVFVLALIRQSTA